MRLGCQPSKVVPEEQGMVEAAGVEPASEKARHEETTMRIRLE